MMFCKPGDPNGKTCKQVLDNSGYKDLNYTMSRLQGTPQPDGTERYTLSIPCNLFQSQQENKCQTKTWWEINTPEIRLASYSSIPMVKLDGTIDFTTQSNNESLSLR
jgi:hypothetical protein